MCTVCTALTSLNKLIAEQRAQAGTVYVTRCSRYVGFLVDAHSKNRLNAEQVS